MANKNASVKMLEDKVTDYKRFAFILLALCVFMFIGLVIPNEGVSQIQDMVLIGLSLSSVIFAVIFHRKAMNLQNQLYSDEK